MASPEANGRLRTDYLAPCRCPIVVLARPNTQFASCPIVRLERPPRSCRAVRGQRSRRRRRNARTSRHPRHHVQRAGRCCGLGLARRLTCPFGAKPRLTSLDLTNVGRPRDGPEGHGPAGPGSPRARQRLGSCPASGSPSTRLRTPEARWKRAGARNYVGSAARATSGSVRAAVTTNASWTPNASC